MTMILEMCKSAHMSIDEDQEAARRFLREILRATGWPPSRLAKLAGMSPSTLTRFLNGSPTHTLSSRTISKIRAAAGRVLPHDQIDQFWLLSQRRPKEPSAA